MTLGQIVRILVNEDGATRLGIVAKIVGDRVNVKVLTEGKPESDLGVSRALVKQGERRVDSLFLVGVSVGTDLGCIVADAPDPDESEPAAAVSDDPPAAPPEPSPPKPGRAKATRRSGVS